MKAFPLTSLVIQSHTFERKSDLQGLYGDWTLKGLVYSALESDTVFLLVVMKMMINVKDFHHRSQYVTNSTRPENQLNIEDEFMLLFTI